MPPTTPTSNDRESESLNERTRSNIKLVKVIRGVSDEDIAKLGFTSRQVVADRVGGRTVLSLDDVDRFAAALGVSRDALILSRAELIAWLDEHPETAQQPARVAPMKGRKSPKKAPTTRKRRT